MNLELGYVDRRKWSWTDFREAQADDVITVVNALLDYQPLTLRQIFYQLVVAGKRENTRSKYSDLSKLIVAMREAGKLPWEIIDDRARRLSRKRGYEDAGEYAKQVGDFLGRYQRCLVQDQEFYVETWCEKDALSMILEEIAWPYCIRHATAVVLIAPRHCGSFRNGPMLRNSKGSGQCFYTSVILIPAGCQRAMLPSRPLQSGMESRSILYGLL